MPNRTDAFTRADSSTTLGTPTDAGSAWSALSGTWGISSNQGYCPSGGSHQVAVLDAGAADVTVDVTMPTIGGDAGIALRAADDNNYILCSYNTSASSMEIYAKVGGGYTQLGSTVGLTLVAGDAYTAVASGTAITFKQNGVTRVTGTSSAGQTNTLHGIRANNNSSARFDNFAITAAVGADTTAPVVASAAINAAGTTLTVNFTEAGSPPVLPATGVTGFTLAASGGAATLSGGAISGTTATFTVSRAIATGETVGLYYSGGNVTDSAATPNNLASFSNTAVTNNSTQPAPATTYTAPLSPTTITAGQTTTATVTPNANYTGTVTGTPSGSASTGMTAQTTSAWSSNAVAKTVSWTPTAAGTLTITWTNSGSLTNPSNGTVTVNAAALAAGTVSFDSGGPAGGTAFLKATATAATGGTPTYTYQWQRNVGGGSYSNISGAGVTGATTLTLTDATVTAGNLYGYRIVATDSAGTPATATSGAVTAQVYTGGALTGGGFRRISLTGGF